MRNLFNKKVMTVLITIIFTVLGFVALSQSNHVATQSVERQAGSTPQSSPQVIEELQSITPEISGQIQDEQKDLVEYQKWKERIRALSESRDLSGLVHLSDKVEFVWGKKSAKLYAGLMFEVCGAMGSYDFDNDEQYVLARVRCPFLPRTSQMAGCEAGALRRRFCRSIDFAQRLCGRLSKRILSPQLEKPACKPLKSNVRAERCESG